MRPRKHKNIFFYTNTQRVLSFLIDYLNEDLLAIQVQKATKVSKAGVYRSLEILTHKGLVKKTKKGRVVFYRINEEDFTVRQYKILKALSSLKPLILNIQALSRKIILFGSVSKGEDYLQSDIDLFIIAKNPQQLTREIAAFKSKRKLQCVIKTIGEALELEEEDPVFLSEVNSGIVLWEEKDVH